ncbi:DUF302 domain-containing protein [Pseudophaeobacter sp.]|uniref:DUF302 domain-containing protein n=1 Tax=Pseudophaeobacter sp. TaxID=1971739 RepID=UPI0032969E27
MRVLFQPRTASLRILKQLPLSLARVSNMAISQAVLLALFLTSPLLPASVQAEELSKRDGWVIFESSKPYETLLQDLRAAVKAEGLVVVTQVGPTKAAAARGITIPGNRVVGVFNNDYAVRVLALSTAAMIEAPIRFYVTEVDAAHTHLAYKRPSFVFSPYINEGGSQLVRISAELDRRFAAIAEVALH